MGRTAAIATAMVAALALTACAARAQEPAGGAHPDSAAVEPSAADAGLPPASPSDPLEAAGPPAKMAAPSPPALLDQPRFVMMRSLLLPGWGQLHNRKWLKAALIGGAEIWLATRLVDDDRALDGLQAEVDAAREAGDGEREQAAILAFNERLDTFVARQWYLGGLVAYALLDAYVDAHFRDFEIEFRPERGARGARAGLRWSF